MCAARGSREWFNLLKLQQTLSSLFNPKMENKIYIYYFNASHSPLHLTKIIFAQRMAIKRIFYIFVFVQCLIEILASGSRISCTFFVEAMHIFIHYAKLLSTADYIIYTPKNVLYVYMPSSINTHTHTHTQTCVQ